LLDLVEPRAYAQTKLSFSGEDDGWKYTVDATPESGRLNLQMTVSREWEGLDVKIEGSGYVQKLRERHQARGQGQSASGARFQE